MLVLHFLLGFAPAPSVWSHVMYSWPLCLKVFSYHVVTLHGLLVFVGSPRMEVLAYGEEEDLTRPCVDCGLYTGRFCDHCFASWRVPSEEWCRGQRTPLCSRCDNLWDACHFCRGEHWCTPPAWGPAADFVKRAQAKRELRGRSETSRRSNRDSTAIR